MLKLRYSNSQILKLLLDLKSYTFHDKPVASQLNVIIPYGCSHVLPYVSISSYDVIYS